MYRFRPPNPRFRRSKPRRGMVLVAVLAILALCSAILFAFVEEATERIKHSALFFEQDDLRAEAYSYHELALAVLSEIQELDGALYAPNQGWGDPLGYAGVQPPNELQVRIDIEDESSRLSFHEESIRGTDSQILMMALEELGFDLQDAYELADSLKDWQDADDAKSLNGAEADYYERFVPEYRPPNQPIATWQELRLIKGFSELFYDEDGRPLPILGQFTELFSLHASGRVNENTARPMVRRILQRVDNVDRDVLGDYLLGPDREAGTGDDRYRRDATEMFLPEGGSGLNFEATRFRVTVEVTRGESRFLLQSLVELGGGRGGRAPRTQGEVDAQPADGNEGGDAGDNPQRELQRQGAELTRGQRGRDERPVPNYPFTLIILYENDRL